MVSAQERFFLSLAPLRPNRSPVTGRQVKTEKKRGPSCTREGETACPRTGSRAWCACRGSGAWPRHRSRHHTQGRSQGANVKLPGHCTLRCSRARSALVSAAKSGWCTAAAIQAASSKTCGPAIRPACRRAPASHSTHSRRVRERQARRRQGP